jgi:hypothetical protein
VRARSLVLIVSFTRLVHAGDPRAADALFEEAKQHLARGDWAAGCSLLDASMKEDPSPSTELKLARCREREGKLVEAAALVRHARGLNGTKNADRPELRVGLDRLAATYQEDLDRRTPRLTLGIADRPADVRAAVDGRSIELDASVALDPGPHSIHVEAPHHKTLSLEIVVSDGDRRTVMLQLAPEEAAVALPVAAHPAKGSRSTVRPAAIALGAGALVTLAGATYFGLRARSELARSDASCDASDACTPAGVEHRDHARTARNVSVALGAAGLGLGLGALAVQWRAAETSTPVALRAGGHPHGASFSASVGW